MARRVKIKQEEGEQQADPTEEGIKPQAEPEAAAAKAPKVKKNTEPQYEVEKILDDSGSRKAGDKKFLIRWKEQSNKPIQPLHGTSSRTKPRAQR